MTYLALALSGAIQPMPAGPVNGVLTLRHDVRQSAEAVIRAYGPGVAATFDRRDYERLLRESRDNPRALTENPLPAERMRNFVLGVMADVASAVARAQQLADLTVSSEANRTENHRAQAELVGAARIMLDSATGVLRGVVPVERNGTSGLGAWPVVLVIGAATAVYLIVGITTVSLIALVYDSRQRMNHARQSANEFCERNGGCSAEEYAAIVSSLQIGPLERLADGGAAALEDAGKIAAITAAVVVGGAAVLGGAYWLFATDSGRRLLSGVRKERDR